MKRIRFHILSTVSYILALSWLFGVTAVMNLINLSTPHIITNFIGYGGTLILLALGVFFGAKAYKIFRTETAKLLIAIGPALILAYLLLFAFLP